MIKATETMDLETAYKLCELEVFNWGPFSGRHRAEIDSEGSAIIGPTGSGKTTLVDALMTLLAQNPKYNLASTGGHESDRDTISYVRGVYGAESATGENTNVARPKKTITGISAKYSNGEKCVILGVLLWVDGTSNAAKDLKKRWFFSEVESEDLKSLLLLHQVGGLREITRHEKDAVGLRTFASKKEYLARVRGFFGVGENAFSLLNRAAGLKQLNSIDQIFRELVLDDRSAFDRALEVSHEFDNLAGIHEELETAKRQCDSLVPVKHQHILYLKAKEALDRKRHLKAILPVWYAIVGEQMWSRQIETLEEELVKLNASCRKLNLGKDSLEARIQTLNETYLQLGGHALVDLEAHIEDKKKLLRRTQVFAHEYKKLVRFFELSQELSETELEHNKRVLEKRKGDLLESCKALEDAAFQAQSKLREFQQEQEKIKKEVEIIRQRPNSNIPSKYHDFREQLAAQLNVRIKEVPYLAELVEVKPEDRNWRGAIERAIGSERLRILVPEQLMGSALSWVNSRHNRLHVRLQRVQADEGGAQFFQDGFTRKLNYRNHPYRESVKLILASIDRHCVTSTESLQSIEYAMTAEGTMSGRRGKFEKQDQKSLSDNWMTGFDNTDRLQRLEQQFVDCRKQCKQLEQEVNSQRQNISGKKQEISSIEGIEQIDFEQIDTPKVETELNDLLKRYEMLVDPDSDAASAKAQLDEARQEKANLESNAEKLNQKIGSIENKRTQALQKHSMCVRHKEKGLGEEDLALASSQLPVQEGVTVDGLDELERKTDRSTADSIEKLEEKLSSIQLRLVNMMNRAQKEDTGALIEVGTELADVPDYLDRLKVLQTEALPEKQKRFLEYLNRSSGQGVTQLLTSIENEVSIIEERIEDLNRTLSRVEFRRGHFLQLVPAKIQHDTIHRLNKAQRHVRAAMLEEDQGESHFKALRRVIEILRDAAENKRTLASQALLDPRYRLQFSVVEVDQVTRTSSAPRKGSQTGSGGEKEMLASYILTASLSYALSSSSNNRPLYATIVLDEAFSKSSQAAAARIIEALREFGLHPLFVTPNKEMSLLRAHTRSAVLVHNKNKQASLTSITWEDILKRQQSKELQKPESSES